MTSCVAESEYPPGCVLPETIFQAAQARDLGFQLDRLRIAVRFTVSTLKKARTLHAAGVDVEAWDFVSRAEHELFQALR